jgi:hypothetical protein
MRRVGILNDDLIDRTEGSTPIRIQGKRGQGEMPEDVKKAIQLFGLLREASETNRARREAHAQKLGMSDLLTD